MLRGCPAASAGSDRECQAGQVAMPLFRDETDLTLAAIGQRYKGIHYLTVGQTIRRVQAAMPEDRELGRL